jgi:ABC-type phosphate/phosphonate transport system substrate-binding protein
LGEDPKLFPDVLILLPIQSFVSRHTIQSGVTTLTRKQREKMELIFSPLVYNTLILEDANSVFYRYIQQLNPDLFSSQIESFESFHSCWVSPQLGLGQITGSQLTQEYSDFLTVLGIPVCAANGCRGKYYRSALLIHKRHHTLNNLEDVIHAFPSLTLAVNSFGSNSGWFFLMATLAKYCEEHSLPTLPNIEKIIQTGSQNGSILSLLTGEAHMISLDCISLEFMTRYYPSVVKDVKIIGWTEKSLAPPFVTSIKHSLAIQKKIQELLFEAVTSNDDESLVKARQGLLLTGMELNPLDGTPNNDFGKEYFDHINYHKSLINKYFPNLLDSLTPGRLLRDHKEVFVRQEKTRCISPIDRYSIFHCTSITQPIVFNIGLLMFSHSFHSFCFPFASECFYFIFFLSIYTSFFCYPFSPLFSLYIIFLLEYIHISWS